MAYYGYLTWIKQQLYKIKEPKILEIGTDKGVSFISLAYFLARTKPLFSIYGIDIFIREEFELMARNIDLTEGQDIKIYRGNSLQILPTLWEEFDIILLDGDHNYFTISKELEILENLVNKDNSIIIIDDYFGRWSEKDLFYSTKDEYANIDTATQMVNTEKHGVKAAVDDHIAKFPGWYAKPLMQGEPIVLSRKEIIV
jgi:predicted O-methyltransferase YrrM